MDELIKFKTGDFIVSGKGNVGIFLSVIVEWDSFFRLTETGSHAGTDWRYARYATEDEKKAFIEKAIKANLRYEDRKLLYKVAGIKKRYRPSVASYNELQEKIDSLREDYNRSVSAHKQTEAELIDLRGKIGIYYVPKSEYVESVKENERLRKEIERWRDSCKQLENRYHEVVNENEQNKSCIVGLKERLGILKKRGLIERILNKYVDL